MTVAGADGRRRELPGKANVRLGRGDVVVVESCGGGGYGAPEAADSVHPRNPPVVPREHC